MQFPWLEKLVKEGHVSAAARAEIYGDCSEVLRMSKTANVAEAAASVAGGMMGLAIVPLIGSLFQGLMDKKEVADTVGAVAQVRKDLLAMPEFGAHKDKADARFNEIAKIAPTVARNKPLVVKIMKEKLHSGLTAQDVQSLAMIQAQHTPRYSIQSAMQKQASDVRAGETCATMYFLCKEAGLSGKTLGRALTNLVAMTGVSVAGGVGVGTVKHYLAQRDKKQLEERLRDSYSQAMKLSDPDKEPLHANKDKARQAFQALAHFAPHVAVEPHAARSFMNKMVAYDSLQPSDVKDLTEIERNFRQSKPGNPFFEGLAQGTKALGLDSAVKGTVEAVGGPLHHEVEEMAAQDLGYVTGGKRATYKM